VEGPPNPWASLHEDAKSYITLATALLGVSATFASGLLSEDTLGRWVVVAGWATLCASIACSIVANGRIFSGLRGEHAGGTEETADGRNENGDNATVVDERVANPGKRRYNRTLVWLNVSVWALLVGTALLAVGAWRTAVSSDDSLGGSPAELAKAVVAEMTGADQQSLTVETLEKSAANDFTLVVQSSSSGRFEAVVDGDRSVVVSVRPLP